MMDREEIAVELTKALLKQENFSYDSTNELLYDAVEMTDVLLNLLARAPGSVKIENYDDEMEKLAEQEASVVKEEPKTGWFK